MGVGVLDPNQPPTPEEGMLGGGVPGPLTDPNPDPTDPNYWRAQYGVLSQAIQESAKRLSEMRPVSGVIGTIFPQAAHNRQLDMENERRRFESLITARDTIAKSGLLYGQSEKQMAAMNAMNGIPMGDPRVSEGNLVQPILGPGGAGMIPYGPAGIKDTAVHVGQNTLVGSAPGQAGTGIIAVGQTEVPKEGILAPAMYAGQPAQIPGTAAPGTVLVNEPGHDVTPGSVYVPRPGFPLPPKEQMLGVPTFHSTPAGGMFAGVNPVTGKQFSMLAPEKPPTGGAANQFKDRIPIVNYIASGQLPNNIRRKDMEATVAQLFGPNWRQDMAADPQGFKARAEAWGKGGELQVGKKGFKITPGGVQYRKIGN